MSSPAEPPKLNANQALDSRSPKELSDNDGGLLPPTASRPDDAPPDPPACCASTRFASTPLAAANPDSRGFIAADFQSTARTSS